MDSKPPFDAGARFEVRRQLGAGGMGVVYEAYDRERKELVALKTLRQAEGHWLARFKQEFRAIHDLAHPNLAALNELFEGESGPFFTMELIRGVDFLAYVRGEEWTPVDPLAETGARPATSRVVSPALPLVISSAEMDDVLLPAPREARAIAYDEARLRAALKQLAMGIAALHAAGKVHRDIKPSNILVTTQGRVVLLDFGLVAGAADAHRSAEGSVVGTVAYMAPEQALSGDVTPAADWYSLGVVLFEALTGALPHRGRTPYEVIIKKQQFMAAPPRQFVATVPPDLDALCTGLLQTQMKDRPRARDIFDRLGIDPKHQPTLDGSAASASLTDTTPFVGRADELRRLRAGYDRSRAAALIYLVEGVSGVGKSQLVARFLEGLAESDPDTVVLSGRCYEREVVSYKAFDGIADALARYLGKLPPVQVAELLPLRTALLARLFPVLKRVEAIAMAPEVPDVPDPHDQRRRMFAALRELFARLAKRRRLVWYIDDLQWTDADSLVLLQDLIAHEDALPVLLIATIRPVDDAPRKALLAKLENLAPTQRLLLAELTPGEARKLTGLLLPGRDPATLDAIAADAGGHPLFLQELARHTGGSHDATAVGATFDEMLTTRIDQLGGSVRRLLQVISVFGGPLTQEVAALAAELSEAEQVKVARVLRGANLARTDGVLRTDRIVIYHDRVREHVTAALDDATLRHVHNRLALALEQTGAAEHSPRALVRHARAAGRHSLAATYALTAAGHAVSSLAFDQAAELYAVAIELGSYDDATLRSLRIDLATALVNAGRGPEAANVFMAAGDGAEPAVRLDCQRQAADQWIITGHIEQGMAALRSSLADIGEPLAASPRRALARVLWNRARLRLRGMGFEARRESQVPVELLRRLDVLKAVAHGLGMVDNVRGADFNGRFLLMGLRTGVPGRLVQAMATEVLYLTSQGGAAGRRGRRVFARMAKLVEDSSEPLSGRSWMLLADGGASYLEGRFAEAVVALAECETLLREHTTGTTFLRNNTRVLRVHALRQLGALQENGTLIAEAVRSGRQRGDQYLETTLQFLRGTALLAQDLVAEAHATLAGATWSPPDIGYHMQHWSELRARAEIALYEGTARPAIEQLRPKFALLDGSMLLRLKIIRAEALSTRGRLLLAAAGADGADRGARAAIEKVTRSLERERVGYATVYALLLRAGLCDGSDDEEKVAYLRRAIDEAARSGMALHVAAARLHLGRMLRGDEGAELCAAAAAYAASEGIRRPERMYAVVAPGLSPP